MRAIRMIMLAGFVTVAGGCDLSCISSDECPDDDVQLPNFNTLSIIAGNNQVALAGTRLPIDLVVELKSVAGSAAGTAVTWTVVGGGALSDAATSTDASGRAKATWTVGGAVSINTVTVTAGNSTVLFFATVYSPFVLTNAGPITVEQGCGGVGSLRIVPTAVNGFVPPPLDLSIDGVPEGLSVVLAMTRITEQINSGGTTVGYSVVADEAVPPGSYTVTARAQKDDLLRETSIPIEVSSPPCVFSLVISPTINPLVVAPGSNGTARIDIQRAGAAGSAAIDFDIVSAAITGVGTSFAPNPAGPAATYTDLAVSVANEVEPGDYPFRLRGMAQVDGETVTRHADLVLRVTEDSNTGSISGFVTGNGNGVGDATVTLTGPVSTTTTSGAGGHYSFTNLPAGSYTVRVDTELNIGFPANPQAVNLAAGEARTLNFAGTY